MPYLDQDTAQGFQASGVNVQRSSQYQYTFASVDPNGTLHCKVTFTGSYTSSDNKYTYQHNTVVGFQIAETPTTSGIMSMGILPTYDGIRGPLPKVTVDTQPTIQSDTITSKVTNASIQEKNEQDQKEGAAAMQFLQKLNCRLWLPGTDGKLYCAMPQLP
jgi:hypothetical protein